MRHEDVKKLLLADEETKKEYDALEPIYAITSEVIRLRIEKGLTQKDLAIIVGTKQSAISRLESGSYNPSFEFLSKVAHALGKELNITFN
jgi:DNA-binding XRE family transcriptional regulator